MFKLCYERKRNVCQICSLKVYSNLEWSTKLLIKLLVIKVLDELAMVNHKANKYSCLLLLREQAENVYKTERLVRAVKQIMF